MATAASGGSYAFELEQTSVTNLTLGTPYSGTLAGSGQAQLFAVSVPATQALLVTLKDSTSTDVNQIYAKLGSPPTPGDYDYEFADGVAASQQLLVPSAAPGTGTSWSIPCRCPRPARLPSRPRARRSP